MTVFNKRTNKSGVSYQAIIRVKGYKTLCKTFKLKSDARIWAEPIETAMKKGIYKENTPDKFDDERKNIKTVKELINYFRENIAPVRYGKLAYMYDCMYDWWIDKIGDINVVDVTPAILSSCKMLLINTEFLKGKNKVHYSGSTINKYLYCLSAVLRWCVRELEIIQVNPMSKVEHMKNLNERTRRLSDEEIKIYMEGCSKHSLMCLVFFLLLQSTGGRYSEVQNLTVETIDFSNSRVVFMDTKNGTNRSVAIDRRLLDLIKRLLDENEIKSGYIFVNKKGKLKYMRGILEKIKKDCNIEDCHIHDLRHTFASIGAENGASIYDIMILLGHKSMSMAKRYTHLTQKYQDKIALKIANTMPVWNNF